MFYDNDDDNEDDNDDDNDDDILSAKKAEWETCKDNYFNAEDMNKQKSISVSHVIVSAVTVCHVLWLVGNACYGAYKVYI